MDILATIIIALIAVIGLTFVSFTVMFLVENINSEHQEHLGNYDQED